MVEARSVNVKNTTTTTTADLNMCVHVYVCYQHILDVRLVDLPAEVTQEEGHTEFLHLASAVLALIFLARRMQPFLSLFDREVEFCILTNQSFSTCCIFIYFFFVRKNPSSCDCT